jgi:hypothetical protein
VSESQPELLADEPAEELPELIAPLPPLVLDPPTLEPLVPPALEPAEPPSPEPLEVPEPPTLLPDELPALPVEPPALPALAPALLPAPLPAPPAPPPDWAYAVIAKRAAAVAVTRSFNFMC